MEILADIGGVLLFAGIAFFAWMWVIGPILYRPPITHTLDYLYNPAQRRRIEHQLDHAQERVEPPRVSRFMQKVQALLTEREQTEKPIPAQSVGPGLDHLARNNPREYATRVFDCIERLYESKNARGEMVKDHLTRDGVVPAVLSQVEWDHLIGPEDLVGQKEPGRLRELHLIHEKKLIRSEPEAQRAFLWGYMTAYGGINPEVFEVVRKTDANLVLEWERRVYGKEQDNATE